MDSTQSWPDTVAIGDVTGDGRNDVVMVTLAFSIGVEVDQKVLVYEQNLAGGLNAPRLYRYADGLFGQVNSFGRVSLYLAHMNHDQTLDIVVAYGKGLSLMLSSPGGFTTRKFLMPPEQRTPELGDYYAKLVVALDINRDGNRDIVLFNWYGGAFAFYGDGQGNLTQIQAMMQFVLSPSDAKVGDYNSDGYDDLAVLSGERSQRTFYIFPNNGVHGFGPPLTNRIAVDDTYGGIAMGDWNGDTRTDVAVSIPRNVSSGSQSAGILIYEQDEAGRLRSPYVIPTIDIPLALVSEDIDGDRREDLITEHNGWGQIGYLIQTATGLQSEQLVRTGGPGFNTTPIAVGDINSDGCKDVVMAETNFGLGVLMAQSCINAPRVMSSPLPPRTQ